MYDLPLLSARLEDVKGYLSSLEVDSPAYDNVEEALDSVIEDTKPQSNMVCKFCGEPFTDWFERTLHYDTCPSIARNRTKNTVDTHKAT
jgi:hypothetical protein